MLLRIGIGLVEAWRLAMRASVDDHGMQRFPRQAERDVMRLLSQTFTLLPGQILLN